MTLVRPKKRFLFGGAGALLALAAVTILVLTQVQSGSASHVVGSPAHSVNQYSAKFLCGPIFGPADPFKPLAPGMYNTAINIHNPNDFQVMIQKKAVISVPERNGPPFGVPGARDTEILNPDGSMEIDCSDVALLLNGAVGGAVPPCGTVPTPPPPPVVWGTDFCKGYVVIEAARLQFPPLVPVASGVPAQLDVTDILTVKEEDGIWKDYTFQLYCTLGAGCPQIPNPAATIRYSQPSGSYALGTLFDMNLPVRPQIPPCYNDFNPVLAPCNLYDTDKEIRNGLRNYCQSAGGNNCINFLMSSAPNLYVEFKEADYATDSRDVSLDFEFVNPKVVRYNCWPKTGVVQFLCP